MQQCRTSEKCGIGKTESGDDLLSRGISPSTIGAGGLNFRVRDGNGCGPSALVTGNISRESNH
jgi:hypothetical protein